MSLSDDLQNRNERQNGGAPMGLMTIGAIGVITLIVIAVLYANGTFDKPKAKPPVNEPDDLAVSSVSDDSVIAKDGEYPLGQSDLVSDDLDFWNMYAEGKPEHQKIRDEQAVKYEENEKELLEEIEAKEKEEDLSEGGIKTEVILPDGESQWIMINQTLKKNDYDYVGLVDEAPFKRYYSDGKRVSKQGLILKEDLGTINFETLKKNGIEFVIVRVGRRGYSTGEITEDNYAPEYIKAAYDAGLSVGVSFYSQAISPEEAVEEAGVVLNILGSLELRTKYPICFDLETVSNDKSRTSELTKDELSAIAKTFCDSIRGAGYTPIIYGNKYRLLRKLDLTKLKDERVFLSEDKDVPDYPYEFDMWEYNYDASISGISGKVPMVMSFVDYDMR
ncbi:MAG TPA: hypothetical protein DCG85_01265 [Lachnospiraceae bacterium]|nr:hypothetical protein [Lachnospiraceae bacterium]